MAVEYLLSCNKEKQQPSTHEILDLTWLKTLVIDYISNIFSIFVTMYHEILCLYLYFQNMGKNLATLQMCMCVRVGGVEVWGMRTLSTPPFPPSFMISLQGDAH